MKRSSLVDEVSFPRAGDLGGVENRQISDSVDATQIGLGKNYGPNTAGAASAIGHVNDQSWFTAWSRHWTLNFRIQRTFFLTTSCPEYAALRRVIR